MAFVKSLPNNSLEVKKHLRTIFLTNAQQCAVGASSKQSQTNLSSHNCNISHGGNAVDSELSEHSIITRSSSLHPCEL